MAATRKNYSKEFKQKAVELSNVRGNVQEVARELSINPEFIYRWRTELANFSDLAFWRQWKEAVDRRTERNGYFEKRIGLCKNGARYLKKKRAVNIFSMSDRKSTNSRRIIVESFQSG